AVEADPNFSTTLPDPNRDGQQVTVGLPEVQLFDAYVNSLRVEVALSLAYVRDPGNEHLIPVDPPVPVNGGGPPAIFASGGGSGSAGSGGVSGGSTGGGTIVPTVPPSPFASLDANHDGKLTPDEYLPPSPFLTLRDPALLTTAQKAMLATADQETKGINGVLARPADAVFLVSNTDAVRAVLTETRDKVVPLIQQAATGPVTIDVPRYGGPLAGAAGSGPVAVSGSDQGGVFSVAPKPPVPSGGAGVAILPIAFTTEPVTIDIAAWFKQPPADLKAFAPTYTLDANGFPDPSLTKYPDPTFGGLYPNGLPTDLML
ncbi:MAG TPA: hypothetical protein VKT77_11305, partial [Chthonomonadaceae bacterium]|nr:hypothetical protein [Chthonomonadaceae bacterium]